MGFTVKIEPHILHMGLFSNLRNFYCIAHGVFSWLQIIYSVAYIEVKLIAEVLLKILIIFMWPTVFLWLLKGMHLVCRTGYIFPTNYS